MATYYAEYEWDRKESLPRSGHFRFHAPSDEDALKKAIANLNDLKANYPEAVVWIQILYTDDQPDPNEMRELLISPKPNLIC